MMIRLQTALMIAVISGLCLGALPASAASDFDKGTDLYGKGQFQAATEAFVDAICANPNYYPAHYALANSYMKLGKLDQAQTEYEMCLELYPDKVTKANCNKALAYLNGSSRASVATTRNSHSLDAMLAAEGQRRAEKAQAAVAQQKAAIETKAQQSAERYKENAKAQIEAMKANSSWYTVDVQAGKMVPVIPVGTEATLFEQAERQAEHAKNTAKSKAESIKPSLGTTDVTDGLRSQIHSGSGVRLSPVGTNIYVRNYEVAGKSGGVR